MKKQALEKQRSYGGVRASQREEGRRLKLLDAGLGAFGTVGYARSSIKGICGLAGLTERYFYESFGSKEELLLAVYGGVVEDLLARARERLSQPFVSPSDLLTGVLGIYFRAMREDPRKARLLYFEVLGVSPAVDRAYQDATRLLGGIVTEAVLAAFPVLDRRFFSESIVPVGLTGAVTLMAINWILEGFRTPLEDILSQVAFLAGLVESFAGKSSPPHEARP